MTIVSQSNIMSFKHCYYTIFITSLVVYIVFEKKQIFLPNEDLFFSIDELSLCKIVYLLRKYSLSHFLPIMSFWYCENYFSVVHDALKTHSRYIVIKTTTSREATFQDNSYLNSKILLILLEKLYLALYCWFFIIKMKNSSIWEFFIE